MWPSDQTLVVLYKPTWCNHTANGKTHKAHPPPVMHRIYQILSDSESVGRQWRGAGNVEGGVGDVERIR